MKKHSNYGIFKILLITKKRVGMDNNPIQKTDSSQNTEGQNDIMINGQEVKVSDKLRNCYGMPIAHKPQSNKPKYQQANPLIVFSISTILSILIAIILYRINGITIYISETSKTIPMLILPMISTAGFAIGIGTYINEQKNKDLYTQIATGKCVSMDKKLRTEIDGDIRVSYIPTYIYEANGQNYSIISKDSYSWLFKPSIGSDRQILLNPGDPSDAFVPKSTMQIITTIILCTLLTVGGFALFYYYMNR